MTEQEPPIDRDAADELVATAGWYAPEMATFGDRLAAAREAAGLTQAQLAKRIGVRSDTVRNWEQDISEPRAHKLQMLSGLLDVSLAWLLEAEGAGPAALTAPGDDDLARLLADLRDTKNALSSATQKVAHLEKRLRVILETRAP